MGVFFCLIAALLVVSACSFVRLLFDGLFLVQDQPDLYISDSTWKKMQ